MRPGTTSGFLDYAAERVFLRKFGGGYIFTHRLLMEYFATLRLADLRNAKLHGASRLRAYASTGQARPAALSA
jgi:hypothetical protein